MIDSSSGIRIAETTAKGIAKPEYFVAGRTKKDNTGRIKIIPATKISCISKCPIE